MAKNSLDKIKGYKMDLEYDQKFEEMKKYIPFMENIIKRLESSEQSSNPRQAQLDKIRSLRDLLLDKKKRMKMENLLKCEQVLINNLYAIVEQRNMQQSVDVEKTSTEKHKKKIRLNAVINKLKSIVKPQLNIQETTDTLPEIARASNAEEICVLGSKEPALFQRSPNKTSNSVNTSSLSSAHETEVTPSKRNYTRVLQSPEADEIRRRSSVEKSDKQLFSRRSPHRRTESSSRKERKKLKEKGKHAMTDDLIVTNITLQVPEESLPSLNTDDILHGSGYGVKNYKIPKIKRQSTEIEVTETIETKTDITKKDTKNDRKSLKGFIDIDDNINPIHTTTKIECTELVSRTETHEETNIESNTKNVFPVKVDESKIDPMVKNVISAKDNDLHLNTQPKNSNKEEGIKISSSISTEISKYAFKCPVDGLEIFEEKLVSNPVIDSINSLKADLDHDLGVDAAKDISIGSQNFEKLDKHTMSENVEMSSDTKQEKPELKPDKPKESGDKISEMQNKSESVSLLQENIIHLSNKHQECENKFENTKTEKINVTDELNNDRSCAIKHTVPSSNDSKNSNSEPVVSITGKCDNEEGSINYVKIDTTAKQSVCSDHPCVKMKENVLASLGIYRLAKMVNDHHKDELNVTENESIVEVQKRDAVEANVIEEKETLTNFNSNNDPESKNESSSDSDSVVDILANKTAIAEKETVEKKKIRRKRGNRGWQADIMKPKNIRKIITKSDNNLKIPDYNCFTDKTYCFKPNTFEYSCRLCVYTGTDIIPHYMKHHPHSEIPLSRLCSDSATEAMKQCQEVNFKAISKMPTQKYTCRFCFKEIAKKKFILKEFFWHVVSTHTGEYKRQCPECEDISKCPFSNDIPPPPENVKGQLLGYICSKCNFTQVSMENLKTHVIIRHNNEETHVYTINLSLVSKKAIKIYIKNTENQNSMLTIDLAESSDEENSVSDTFIKKPEQITNIESKLTFLSVVNFTEISSDESSVKIESVQEVNNKNDSFADDNQHETVDVLLDKTKETINPQDSVDLTSSIDIFTYPHFKVTNINGLKEYVCCINGNDFHYKTSLLISMRKHLQMRHSENWDGYCSMCKVIVAPQGKHNFKDCLNHYLDKHIDDFPTVENSQDEKEIEKDKTQLEEQETQPDKNSLTKSYINIKPLEQLISTANEAENTDESSTGLPVIESVVSLNMTGQPLPSPNYHKSSNTVSVVEYKYEEAQADIMSKKHRVVLDAMMNNTHLVQIFKCAGKFCSFTTDNAEEALLHASTHVRIGGEYALCCVYCDYDALGNAIDLVTHVFKKHGCCPYVCGICFYRAAASQLVQAHINRVHPNSNAQVLRTTVVTGTTDDDDCLPCNTAVPFYRCCGDQDTQNPCIFRTYITSNFCEHIQKRHLNAAQHSCFICSEASSSATELVLHLKIHGLKLYQCTRCVYGADNEPELLGHASAKHPYKQPTAYVRIRINGIIKERSAGFKDLPLAHLDKSKVSVTEVIPNVSAKNPAHEAEKARELETLIDETTSMIESISTSVDTSTAPVTPSRLETPITVSSLIARGASPPVLPMFLTKFPLPTRMTTLPVDRSDLLSAQNSSTEEFPASMDRATVTSVARMGSDIPNIPNVPAESQHLIKPNIEPSSDLATMEGARVPCLLNVEANLAQETNVLDAPTMTTAASSSAVKNNVNTDHVVYCLDSDEEVSTENVIDLSDEIPSTPVASSSKTKVVKFVNLFKCSKCTMVMKSGYGLKRHIQSCYGFDPETVPCAHCDMVIKKSMIDAHLMSIHLQEDIAYVCPVCNAKLKSISAAQKHFKAVHLDTHKIVHWKVQLVGNHIESLSQAQKIVKVDQLVHEEGPKQKRSVGNQDKNSEPPEKLKKFGPHDMDKLPINTFLDDLVYCALCEFSTKVKLNMVRHLQLHAQQQQIADTAPVNPVLHLETNEMHFDKMLNLASSSPAADKAIRGDQTLRAMRRIPIDIAGRYPKYVPDRQHHTCGAKDCSYISVDENMLKSHWETLHYGTMDYHCVHCPPTQHLNGQIATGKIIINHLKMHDVNLYACSICSYYHYNIPIVEKHLNDIHKRGEVLIVRDESSVEAAAPTIDLKPWHCGLCQFKSLLHPEVAEHCAKIHNSKMQYKCGYCAFRTSNLENIPKHQSTSHSGRPEEIFYYYYREGSIPNEADGTPRWMKQKLKMGSTSQVKSDVVDSNPAPPVEAVVLPAIVQKVDLNLVNTHIAEVDKESDMCKEFGEFCEPNGLKYKCPLCQSVTEDKEELMQSHLYKELKYRKWGCPVCSYKAFHKAGFREHAQTEHIQFPHLEAHQLPVDPRIELWTTKLLEHQKTLIAKNKEKLALQKAEIKRTNPSAGIQNLQNVANRPSSSLQPQMKSSKEVEALFGTYGKPSGVLYCCPKCSTTFKEENDMREHLESELSKISWYCNNCSQTFTTYHEAQFHCSARCKSIYPSRIIFQTHEGN